MGTQGSKLLPKSGKTGQNNHQPCPVSGKPGFKTPAHKWENRKDEHQPCPVSGNPGSKTPAQKVGKQAKITISTLPCKWEPRVQKKNFYFILFIYFIFFFRFLFHFIHFFFLFFFPFFFFFQLLYQIVV